MGFRLVTFSGGSKLEKRGRASGNSVIGRAEGDNSRDFEPEVYAAHGIVSRPSKATRGVVLQIGNLSITLAAYTYGVEPPENDGACKVYSTNADGVEAGSHLIDDDGTHSFNGGSAQAARKGDTTKLVMAGSDIQALAVALLATGAFTPSGSPPVPGTPTTFTGGEITSGTSEVLLP